MGNHSPQCETILHSAISSLPSLQTTIYKEGARGRPSAVPSLWISPWVGVWKLGKEENPLWKLLSHRGELFPTLENCFPLRDIIIDGYHFLRLPRIHLTLSVRPIEIFPGDSSKIAPDCPDMRGRCCACRASRGTPDTGCLGSSSQSRFWGRLFHA